MKREEHRLKMLDKLSIILKQIPTSKSIRDISIKTNIPTSTIQEYLHNDKLISELLGLDINCDEYKEFTSTIKSWLDRAKKEGPIYGNKVLDNRYRTRKNT